MQLIMETLSGVCVRQRRWASLAWEEVYSVVYQSAKEAKSQHEDKLQCWYSPAALLQSWPASESVHSPQLDIFFKFC